MLCTAAWPANTHCVPALQDSKMLLVMKFKYVFAYIIRRCDPTQLAKALQFLKVGSTAELVLQPLQGDI